MKVESILRSTVSEETFTILFELLLWINPVKSLCFVTGVHITLFIAYWIISKGILFIVSIILLYKLWKPIWDLEIWPSIQLPEFARLNDWLTLNPEVPPYKESIEIISASIEGFLENFQTFLELRRDDQPKFLLYSSSISMFLALVGLKVSGFTLAYILLVFIFFSPLLLKNAIIAKIQEKEDKFLREKEDLIVQEKERAILETSLLNLIPSSSQLSNSDSEPTSEDNISSYTESEEEEPERKLSIFDPLAEPTWMEDFGHKISENIALVATKVLNSTVKTQLEEAMDQTPEDEKEISGSESADSDKSDFVLLTPEDAKTK